MYTISEYLLVMILIWIIHKCYWALAIWLFSFQMASDSFRLILTFLTIAARPLIRSKRNFRTVPVWRASLCWWRTQYKPILRSIHIFVLFRHARTKNSKSFSARFLWDEFIHWSKDLYLISLHSVLVNVHLNRNQANNLLQIPHNPYQVDFVQGIKADCNRNESLTSPTWSN